MACRQQIGDGQLSALCAHPLAASTQKDARQCCAAQSPCPRAVGSTRQGKKQKQLHGKIKARGTMARVDRLSAQGLTRHAFFDASCRGFWRTAPALAKRRAVYAGLRWTTPDLSLRVAPCSAECARLGRVATCNRCRGRNGPANGSNATRPMWWAIPCSWVAMTAPPWRG